MLINLDDLRRITLTNHATSEIDIHWMSTESVTATVADLATADCEHSGPVHLRLVDVTADYDAHAYVTPEVAAELFTAVRGRRAL